MKRLDWLNLAGVLCVGFLCLFQWRQNRALNLELNRQIEAFQGLTNRLSDQTRAWTGAVADLAEFKRKYAAAEETAAIAVAARTQVLPLEKQVRELSAERSRLQSALSNWVEAVSIRDERLRAARAELERVREESRGISQRYEALATNYNTVVGELNRMQTNASSRAGRPVGSAAPAPPPTGAR